MNALMKNRKRLLRYNYLQPNINIIVKHYSARFPVKESFLVGVSLQVHYDMFDMILQMNSEKKEFRTRSTSEFVSMNIHFIVAQLSESCESEHQIRKKRTSQSALEIQKLFCDQSLPAHDSESRATIQSRL